MLFVSSLLNDLDELERQTGLTGRHWDEDDYRIDYDEDEAVNNYYCGEVQSYLRLHKTVWSARRVMAITRRIARGRERQRTLLALGVTNESS